MIQEIALNQDVSREGRVFISLKKERDAELEDQGKFKTVQERMAEEELVQERIDEDGNRWNKVYFGGGDHFKNWLAQCKELGEVMVEEVDPTGYRCFELAGEKLYRIWMKVHIEKENEEDLF